MQKIDNSKDNIIQMIKDLFIVPRDLMNKWSSITNQTAQVRLAYPSQHLASMITGLPGVGTAARGDDLIDGTDVKSCSRADQLGVCRNCSARVMRHITTCPTCDSTDIEIKEDSHWIFSIRSESELNLLFILPRILLILFDRDTENYIQVRAWQINPKNEYVKLFFSDYFLNNFQKKFKRGERNIAPCNLHPLKYDFYMMSPILIFHAVIIEDNISIKFYNLNNTKSESMPSILLSSDEWKLISKTLPKELRRFKSKKEFSGSFPIINETQRALLKMRIKKIKKNLTEYTRPSQR